MESSFLHPEAVVGAAGIIEGMQVADFGAGSGFFTRAAARAVDDSGAVWAVDANSELLSRIKNLANAEGLHNVEVIAGNVEEQAGSHLPKEHFDFCIIANLLFSAHNKGAIINEAGRILKPSGRVLAIDWRDSFGGLGPHPDHIILQDDAAQLFTSHGFEVVQGIHAGAYHWGFVARKSRTTSTIGAARAT